MNTFQQAIEFVLKWEGKYVNDPKDPGGETNYGIAKRSHPNVDIKNLSLVDAVAIYKREYWDFYRLYNASLPLCIVLLDGYVQHRPNVMKQMAEVAGEDWKLLIQTRIQFYLRLIQKNPELIRFKKGWLNRMNDLSKYCTIILEQQK